MYGSIQAESLDASVLLIFISEACINQEKVIEENVYVHMMTKCIRDEAPHFITDNRDL